MKLSQILKFTAEHLSIVFIAVAIAVAIGIMLSIIAYWVKPVGKLILTAADIIETIPSMALLAMLMIWFGIGNVPIIIALVLYSQLPIIQNTYTGLCEVPPHIKEAAKAMGMSRIQRLLFVELPLAIPLIFTGIKIAIVTSLSTAVMGIFIGSGGLGSPIMRGFQTNNLQLILSGAIPVVLLALLMEYLMSKVEKRLMRRSK